MNGTAAHAGLRPHASSAVEPLLVRKSSRDAIPSVRISETVCGRDTTILCQSYTDRVCVFVSQVGKIGSLIQANVAQPGHHQPMPVRLNGSDPSSVDVPGLLPSTTLLPLFGAPPPGYETLYSLYASHISSAVVSARTQQHARRSGGTESSLSLAGRRPVIVGLGLARMPPTAASEDAVRSDHLDEDLSSEAEGERLREILRLVTDAVSRHA